MVREPAWSCLESRRVFVTILNFAVQDAESRSLLTDRPDC